jgi:hypothetical protein
MKQFEKSKKTLASRKRLNIHLLLQHNKSVPVSREHQPNASAPGLWLVPAGKTLSIRKR